MFIDNPLWHESLIPTRINNVIGTAAPAMGRIKFTHPGRRFSYDTVISPTVSDGLRESGILTPGLIQSINASLLKYKEGVRSSVAKTFAGHDRGATVSRQPTGLRSKPRAARTSTRYRRQEGTRAMQRVQERG